MWILRLYTNQPGNQLIKEFELVSEFCNIVICNIRDRIEVSIYDH